MISRVELPQALAIAPVPSYSSPPRPVGPEPGGL